MTLRTIVLNSPTVRFIYRSKFYLDMGYGQFTWFIGKLPEIMAILYLTEKFGYELSRVQVIIFGALLLFLFALFGVFWKKIGMFDLDVYVQADKNPVTKELLEAARIIKGGRKCKRKKSI